MKYTLDEIVTLFFNKSYDTFHFEQGEYKIYKNFPYTYLYYRELTIARADRTTLEIKPELVQGGKVLRILNKLLKRVNSSITLFQKGYEWYYKKDDGTKALFKPEKGSWIIINIKEK